MVELCCNILKLNRLITDDTHFTFRRGRNNIKSSRKLDYVFYRNITVTESD